MDDDGRVLRLMLTAGLSVALTGGPSDNVTREVVVFRCAMPAELATRFGRSPIWNG